MYRLHRIPPASTLPQPCPLLCRYIVEASEQYAMVQLDVGVRGRLSVLDSSSDPAEMGRFAERFALGQHARAAHFRVVQVSALQTDLPWGSPSQHAGRCCRVAQASTSHSAPQGCSVSLIPRVRLAQDLFGICGVSCPNDCPTLPLHGSRSGHSLVQPQHVNCLSHPANLFGCAE